MEALLATANKNGYSDGDIVEAFSLNRIRLAHAQTLTSVQHYPLDAVSGLRTPNTALEKVLAATHQHKFTFDGDTVICTDLLTGQQSNPSGNFEEYIRRRLMNSEHMLFGVTTVTHWYGNLITQVDAEAVWDVLEEATDYQRADYSFWPLSDLEKTLFLPISLTGKKVTDTGTIDVLLSDPTVDEFRSPSVEIEADGEDEKHILLARRRFKVPYWDFTETLGIEANIARTQMTDIRTSDDIPHVDALVSDKES